MESGHDLSMGDMGRWAKVERTLVEIDALLASSSMRYAMKRFLTLLRACDEAHLAEELTSGGTWNHMGSLFDNDPGFTGPSDEDREKRYSALQLELAEELERLGVASRDVIESARMLRHWNCMGLF